MQVPPGKVRRMRPDDGERWPRKPLGRWRRMVTRRASRAALCPRKRTGSHKAYALCEAEGIGVCVSRLSVCVGHNAYAHTHTRTHNGLCLDAFRQGVAESVLTAKQTGSDLCVTRPSECVQAEVHTRTRASVGPLCRRHASASLPPRRKGAGGLPDRRRPHPWLSMHSAFHNRKRACTHVRVREHLRGKRTISE